MWIVDVIVAGFFLVLGIVFISGKGAFLIAGYNTMPKAERDKYDAKGLCRFMGKGMFCYCGCMLISACATPLNSTIPIWIGWGLFAVVTVFILVFVNTKNRFRK